MTRTHSIIALSAALMLAACSGEQAADTVTANELLAEPLNETLIADPSNDVGAVEPVDAAPAAEPSPAAPAAERPREPAPARKQSERPAPRPPEVKEEPVDPHAGHDMNNMSH